MTAFIIVLVIQTYLLLCLWEMRHRKNLTLTIEGRKIYGGKLTLEGKEAVIETWHRFIDLSTIMWMFYYTAFLLMIKQGGNLFNKNTIALIIVCGLRVFLHVSRAYFRRPMMKSRLRG